MGKTLIQKIIEKSSEKSNVEVGEIVFVKPSMILSHDNSADISKTFEKMGPKKVFDPSKIFIALDHEVPPPDSKKALNHLMIRDFVKKYGIINFFDAGEGICHQVLPEKGLVEPSTVIFGSDSHTTTHGAFGAAGIPMGRTETASLWALGETWLKVPESFKIIIKGKAPENIFPKDVILHIIGRIGADGATYISVEFAGDYIDNMSIGGRMTFCNLSAEMGAKDAIIPVDDITREFLKGRLNRNYETLYADKDAVYAKTIEFDISNLKPQIAKPHKVDNVSDVSEVKGKKIDVFFLGTCTNGRTEDLEIAANILKGKKIKNGCRLLVYPASKEVLLECLDRGIIKTLVEAGGEINTPACGPCLGAYGGVLAPNERSLSTANRNFKGRMGCSENTEIYLASPATVALSALYGEIMEYQGE
ncbi:MAG: 3-isopropylmalate dehydratase large subunit [bacterium (Candidatus Stahlbacteria) CG23_combo_of_CG06-09_8_20_14_all_34_7]|nr:MAG: 3-isopropylmalate dehydratase large subunit [bacterium (Candidatus Stahlbacteria) CG23_combo_of_CG06-09_8_20_14_all_34_7]